MVSFYEKMSNERKRLQEEGLLPSWYTTAGFQLFRDKYQWAATPRAQYETIAATLAAHTDDAPAWRDRFFELLWNGWLSPSTPVLANTGTTRGLPVSCSGGYVGDSIDSFYTVRRETALLTKHGFGTSADLSDVRPRGATISAGGKASGVVPVVRGFVQDSRDVSQGGVRRGSWAAYLPVDHGDFDELVTLLEKEPDDLNVGWNISNDWLEVLGSPKERMDDGQAAEARRRFGKMLKTKLVTGKGYFWFPDKANAKLPAYYPIRNRASNLCSEINLPSDAQHTYTCVLSSMNVAKYDEWKDTDAVFNATVFLDCVASEFLTRARGIPGLENAVRFTEKARALGLGVAGFHTYLQQQGIPLDSLGAVYFNQQLFEKLNEESMRASKWMGYEWGCPQWVQDSWGDANPTHEGVMRNASRLAVAPTKSTALIMGGISEGINPDPAMAFTQSTAGGEVNRVNPVFLELMKAKGVYDRKHIQEVVDAFGSVQAVDWLTAEEKLVFRTAFEYDQKVLIRLAAQRAKYLDQWQSLNLFFSAEEDPRYIAEVHKEAFMHPDILGLYYIYSKSGVKGSRDCLACD